MILSAPVFYYQKQPCFTFGQVAAEIGVPVRLMYAGRKFFEFCEMAPVKRAGNIFCGGLENIGDCWPSYCVVGADTPSAAEEIRGLSRGKDARKGRPVDFQKRSAWKYEKAFFPSIMRTFLLRFCEFDVGFFMSKSLLKDAFFSWVCLEHVQHYFCGDELAQVESMLNALGIPFSGRTGGNLVSGVAFANEVHAKFYSVAFNRPSPIERTAQTALKPKNQTGEWLHLDNEIQL